MSKKLLLADDSITIQKVIGITFVNKDYDLSVVDNGDAAFEKACLERPDLILADVFMPGKTGYELCAAVKQEPSLAGVPVLLLTGTFEPFDEDKARSVGADGWIPKPFESQTLVDRVEALLAKAAEEPGVAAPVAPAAPAAPLAAVDEAAEPAPAAAASPSADGGPPVEELDADLWGDFDMEEPEPALSVDKPLSAPVSPVQPQAEPSAVEDAEDDLSVEDIWGDVSFEDDDLSGEGEPAGSSLAAPHTAEEQPVFTEIQDLPEATGEISPPSDASEDEADDLFGFDDVDLGETFEAEEPSGTDDLGEGFAFEDDSVSPKVADAFDLEEDLEAGDVTDAFEIEDDLEADEEADVFDLEDDLETEDLENAFDIGDDFDVEEVSDTFDIEDDQDDDDVVDAFGIENDLDLDEQSDGAGIDDGLDTVEAPEALADEDEHPMADLGSLPGEQEPADEDLILDLSEDEEILTLDEDDILEELDEGESLAAVSESEEGSLAAAAEAPAADEKPRLAVVPPAAFRSASDARTGAAPPMAPAASVESQVSGLSESDLEAIVERVAGAVIERLAKTVLEKVAWEVVPDLAEALIKDEMNKIRENVR